MSSPNPSSSTPSTYFSFPDAVINEAQQKSRDLTPYNIREFYNGKVLFCTGCTGFLGKVVVEKILRSLPNVKKVYILVRQKKGITNIQQRLHTEVLSSKIMDRLKKELGKEGFEKLCAEKLEAVAGDVELENVLSNKEDLERLTKEVQIVMHSAATISFNERLDVAIRLNTYGANNAMRFAKQCPKIESFLHVSTAYTNCNKKTGSYVQEKQYPLEFPGKENFEDFCQRIVNNKKPEEINKTTNQMLKHFGFPNTYTFTKNMAERLLIKNREHVPLAIVRPTIIGAAVREPHPGWVDVASAGGAVFLSTGVGMLHVVRGNFDSITDHIPVDMVVNSMIIAAAAVAIESKTSGSSIARTFHSGTSSKNPVTWGEAMTAVTKYWQSHKPSRAAAIPHASFVTDGLQYRFQKLLTYTIMTKTYQTLASWIKDSKYEKTAQLLTKVEKRAELMDFTYRHFLTYEWIFDSSNLEEITLHMSKEENDIFSVDLKTINWFTYFHYFCYGLQKHVLKEDPGNITNMDLTKTHAVDWLSDITFSYSSTSAFNTRRNREELKQLILLSSRVQNEIQKEAEKTSHKFGDVQDRALSIMEKMFADPNPRFVRSLAWMFRKVWRLMYQSVVVDENDANRLRQLANNKHNGPLIIVPTHKSYVDFVILTYIFFAYGLPVPHIAVDENFIETFVIQRLFRHSGVFFLRKKPSSDALYSAIFTEYVKELLKDGCPLEFFVEESRSRDGKTHQPSVNNLSAIVESYTEGQIPNFTILPVTINYEKILEGSAYTNELMGEKKPMETLMNLSKTLTVLKNRHGHVYVKFAQPISAKEYTEQLMREKVSSNGTTTAPKTFDPFLNNQDKQELVSSLAYKVSYQFNSAVVCMPTSIVASILLCHRDGLSIEDLTDKAVWLKDQILQRGGQVFWSSKIGTTPSSVVQQAVTLLNGLVLAQKNMVEPNIEHKQEKNLVHLALYRNQIANLFIKESIICASYFTFENNRKADLRPTRSFQMGIVDRDSLLARAVHVYKILKSEFILNSDLHIPADMSAVLNNMIERGVLKQQNNRVITVPKNSDYLVRFLCSFSWPFIESYWLTCMGLMTMKLIPDGADQKKPPASIRESQVIERTQWYGEKLYSQGKLSFYESVSMETIKNAISMLADLGILERKELPPNKATETSTATTSKTYADEDCLIVVKTKDPADLTQLVDFLSRFRKPVASGEEEQDFPLISKL